MDVTEKFDQFYKELCEDVRYDQMNILEKQLMLPAIKHKWVARLIKCKIEKDQLEKKKKDLKEQVLSKLNVPTGIPQASIKQKVESSEVVRRIDEELKDILIIIDYLEKVEKIMSSTTYDIGNAAKLMVLETT